MCDRERPRDKGERERGDPELSREQGSLEEVTTQSGTNYEASALSYSSNSGRSEFGCRAEYL